MRGDHLRPRPSRVLFPGSFFLGEPLHTGNFYYKTVFQTIFLFHLFVHLQDFLYCCLLMHKPRPQTHLKTPTNKNPCSLQTVSPKPLVEKRKSLTFKHFSLLLAPYLLFTSSPERPGPFPLRLDSHVARAGSSLCQGLS